MCMNTILTYLKRGKKALLMLAVKLCADAAESDLPSLVQEHNTLQATLPGNATKKKTLLGNGANYGTSKGKVKYSISISSVT